MSTEKKTIARREFLTAVGRVAGSAAMLRTMTAMGLGLSAASCGSSSAAPGAPVVPPPPSRLQSPRPGDWPSNVGIGKSVVILGAGIAGMTTAFEMTKLGYTCTILEATAVAGGRNRTIRGGDSAVETDSVQLCTFDVDNDLYFNPGPARISHHHEFLLGYCRQFGVPLETFVNENHAALLHSTTAFGGQAQIRRRVVTDTRGNIARLLAKAVNQNALDQDLTPADKTNILAMLQAYGDLDTVYDYTGSERAGFPGQEDTGSRRRGELVAPLPLEQLIGDTFWQLRQDFQQGLDQQPTMLQPVGGMDKIGKAFESQVASGIVYQAVVSEIRKTASGVHVVYQDRFGAFLGLDADYCVCTIPATVLRSIPNDFSAAHQSALNNFTYATAGKIAFQSRRFWEQDHNIYGGISWTTQDITQIWYPNHGFGKNTGVLVGAYMFDGNAGSAFAAQTPQQRISGSVAQGSNVHAEYGTEVGRGISVSWPKVPFQLGAWGTSDPGVLLTPDANIFFAGEHLSLLQGWQEGAILSAYHAIDGVVARDLV
jgi:monoamine oxidase